jgi:hypothetical protein
MIDESLLEFCTTERQKQHVKAKIEHRTAMQAAESLGITKRSLQKSLQQIKINAAKRGWSPQHDMHHSVPDGFVAKGVSTLYDDEGNVKVQWVKSALTQQDKLDAMTKAIEEMALNNAGLAPKVSKPRKRLAQDELACYLIGDAHMGMYAWGDETGNDFDCEIASRDLKYAFDRLVQNAPDSDTALILNLGDFFHFDNQEQTTRASGHSLDGDTRLERVFAIGITVMNYMVKRALEKHKKVICRNVRGNHDDIMSMALKFQMEAYWKNEKRVTIEMSPAPCWIYEFGKVGLLITHGHAPKPNKLPEVFAGMHPELWGRTKHRYALHGHFHSKMTHDSAGIRVEGFSNLAPNDAWHNEQGYLSPQEMTMVVYHKERGEIRRSIERPA